MYVSWLSSGVAMKVCRSLEQTYPWWSIIKLEIIARRSGQLRQSAIVIPVSTAKCGSAVTRRRVVVRVIRRKWRASEVRRRSTISCTVQRVSYNVIAWWITSAKLIILSVIDIFVGVCQIEMNVTIVIPKNLVQLFQSDPILWLGISERL